MFAFGTLVTLMTLSVSLSVTILVPLALKGYIRRDRIIPYVMGANIATWVDTLFAALLLDSPRAFTIVFTEMLVGGSVSLIVLLSLYGPYTRMILGRGAPSEQQPAATCVHLPRRAVPDAAGACWCFESAAMRTIVDVLTKHDTIVMN